MFTLTRNHLRKFLLSLKVVISEQVIYKQDKPTVLSEV